MPRLCWRAPTYDTRLTTRSFFYQQLHLDKAESKAKTPARSKATGGSPFAKSCFALGTRRAELILGLPARLPMPRGRQLGTPRWCHAVHTLPLSWRQSEVCHYVAVGARRWREPRWRRRGPFSRRRDSSNRSPLRSPAPLATAGLFPS